MEGKAKSGAAKSASSSKAEKSNEKKELSTPRKSNPAPADHTPVAPPPEKHSEDRAEDQEVAPEASESGVAGTDALENLKPFLIGGAIIASAAILVGALLLARRR